MQRVQEKLDFYIETPSDKELEKRFKHEAKTPKQRDLRKTKQQRKAIKAKRKQKV